MGSEPPRSPSGVKPLPPRRDGPAISPEVPPERETSPANVPKTGFREPAEVATPPRWPLRTQIIGNSTVRKSRLDTRDRRLSATDHPAEIDAIPFRNPLAALPPRRRFVRRAPALSIGNAPVPRTRSAQSSDSAITLARAQPIARQRPPAHLKNSIGHIRYRPEYSEAGARSTLRNDIAEMMRRRTEFPRCPFEAVTAAATIIVRFWADSFSELLSTLADRRSHFIDDAGKPYGFKSMEMIREVFAPAHVKKKGDAAPPSNFTRFELLFD